jgi:hypothetical protein
VIRPSQALAGDFDRGSVPDWQSADTVIELEGNHFTLIEDSAEVTAEAMEGWLTEAMVR